MVLLLPIFLLVLLVFLLRISKAISKFVAVSIDFLFIGGFTAYSLHEKVSIKIASGNAVYFWDIVFGIGACILYFTLLSYLVIKFPKIAALINYIIAWIGTLLIYGMICVIFIGNFPRLLNNYFLSTLVNIIIITVLAFITFNIRKNIFGTQQNYEEHA
ncbi:hypothetical protein J8TS2_29450 [Lederbergia ruris]|uniref:NADH dehydrogenase subunit 6 n=1 Tax=Lederbergia ruris TaxID=217495 RepID=A0ABQ4KL07_9BACI|nr:hypothetical protein [Lederbergia ruris]GIN58626.1 hypothetical protein J8TS2_29450 [Lederbergia ruris]